jgi:ATP-dependent exoDNAse (exonuclease V) beta subunit
MRALISPLDRVSWLSILRAPWCGISLEDLHSLCKLDRRTPVWDLLRQAERFSQMSVEGQKRADRFINILEPVMDLFPAVNFRNLLEGCWINLGGPACIDTYTTKDIQVFFDKVSEVLDGGDFDNLHNFEAILESLYANPSTGEGHAVQIMTIHKAKGLEFDFVLLPGLGKKSKADEKQLINWITHRENLLFAPIPHSGEKGSDVYAFLKKLEKDRGDFESRRLLYVAATRTKKQLHLFGHSRVNKEGVAPESSSMLGHLWSFIGEAWQETLLATEPKTVTQSEPPTQSQFLRRLPLDFETPTASINLETEPALDITLNEKEIPTPYDWAGTEARCLGNVLHRYFETIAKQGIENWNEQKVNQLTPSLRTALLAEGLSPIKLEDTTQKGLRALNNILQDKVGQKILKHYESEEAELALTYIEGRNFKTKIVDRTYVDEKGVRWIIDYKTGERKGGNVEGFFKQEIKRYRSQLESYEQLIRLQGETRPIKKALYYPLHQRLVEILPDSP